MRSSGKRSYHVALLVQPLDPPGAGRAAVDEEVLLDVHGLSRVRQTDLDLLDAVRDEAVDAASQPALARPLKSCCVL